MADIVTRLAARHRQKQLRTQQRYLERKHSAIARWLGRTLARELQLELVDITSARTSWSLIRFRGVIYRLRLEESNVQLRPELRLMTVKYNAQDDYYWETNLYPVTALNRGDLCAWLDLRTPGEDADQ